MHLKILQLALFAASSSACIGGGEYFLRGYLDWQYEREVRHFQGNEDGIFQIVDKPYFYLYKETGARRARTVIGKCEDAGRVTRVWYDKVNENNHRGEAVDITRLPAGTQRVLFLGDSYTYGDCVAGEAVFHQRIERELRAEGVQVKCINAGVPGYNSVQELALLREIFDQYKPDLVVLGYVMNDAQALVKIPRPPDYTYRHVGSVLFEEAKPMLNWLSRALVRDEQLFRADKLDDGSNNYRRSFEEDSIAWRLSKNALAGMARFCEAKGADFRVVVIPDFTEPFDSRYSCDYIHQAVRSWGREDGYPVKDLLPGFHNQDSSQMRVKYDGHPNELGHRQIAELVLPGVYRALKARQEARK